MKIGIAGPISTASVASHLGGNVNALPKGMSGAPLLGTLITALLNRGHLVSAYTLDRQLPASLEKPVAATGRNGFTIYYGPYRRHSFRTNGWTTGRMVDFFRVERGALEYAMRADCPDVIHAHWTYEYSLAARASGCPYVVTCHDSSRQVLRLMPNLYRLGRHVMARSVLRSAKIVTVVSPYLRDEVQRLCRAPIHVVTNPLPARLLGDCKPKRFSDVVGQRLKIAAVLGGWGKIKNTGVLIEAFGSIRETYGAASLHLYGYDYGPGERAQRWASARSLDAGVVFHGATQHDRLLDELKGMDLLVHPALEEACPLALIEAMALGVPAVGGDRSGGVPWVLGNGEAGVLTDVRSARAISEAVLALVSDPARYERVSQAAVQRVREVFHPDVVAAKYEELYREAVRGTAGK